MILGHGVIGQGQLCPPPPCEGMPRFALSSFYFVMKGILCLTFTLHTSKQYDLIDMFNDTSRYLDDIFTIDNPEFAKHIPDIYISNGTSVEQSNYVRQRNFFP